MKVILNFKEGDKDQFGMVRFLVDVEVEDDNVDIFKPPHGCDEDYNPDVTRKGLAVFLASMFLAIENNIPATKLLLECTSAGYDNIVRASINTMIGKVVSNDPIDDWVENLMSEQSKELDELVNKLKTAFGCSDSTEVPQVFKDFLEKNKGGDE